jgi:predicted  nucleic acid-binding Zn-ribbon protein
MNDHFEAIQNIAFEIQNKEPPPNKTPGTSFNKVLELIKKETQTKILQYRKTIEQLEQQITLKDQEIKRLLEKHKKTEEEIETIKKELENIEQEKNALIAEKEQLKATIEQLKENEAKEEAYKNAVLQSLETIKNTISQSEQLTIEEISTLISTILSSLYAKCSIDLDSIIKKILEDSGIFKHFIIVKANKTFIETFQKYIKNLNNVEIKFIEENLENGEFQIETEDFILERFNKDLLKDVVEKALQNIR